MINDITSFLGIFNWITADSIPTIIIMISVYILIGWFYVHVLGKEFHDFVVFSVLTLILIMIFFLFTNSAAQKLFFGV